jgi:hypothetical protein
MSDEIDYPPGTPEREIAIRRRVHRLAEFYQHLMVFLAINAMLWMLNAYAIYSSPQPGKHYVWWAFWVTFGWGIGVISHALTVLPFWTFFTKEWEDRKIREIIERDRT